MKPSEIIKKRAEEIDEATGFFENAARMSDYRQGKLTSVVDAIMEYLDSKHSQ